MDYIEQLLKAHSRKNTDFITKAIGNNEVELKKIIDVLYSEKNPLPQRASWVLSTVNKNHPELLEPYLSKIIGTINDSKIDGIKRNLLNVLALHKIPKNLQGKLTNICFDFILSPTETVAVKVLSMQCIANITNEYPELIPELRSAIEDQLPKTTAAFHSRAKIILKNIK